MELKNLLTIMKPKMFENSPFPTMFYFITRAEKLPVAKIAEVMMNVFDYQLFLYDEINAKNYPLILMRNSVILVNSMETNTRSLREFLATIPSNIESIKSVSQLDKNDQSAIHQSKTSINGFDLKKKAFKVCDTVSGRLQTASAVNIVFLSSHSNGIQYPKISTTEKDSRFSKIRQNAFEETQASTMSQFKVLNMSVQQRINACPIEWNYHKDRLFGLVYSKIFERKWGNRLGYVAFPKTQSKESRSVGIVPLFMMITALSSGYIKIKAYHLNELIGDLEELKTTQALVDNNFVRFFDIDSVNSKPIIRSESELLLSISQESPSLLYLVFEVLETGQLYFSLIDLRTTQKNFKFARIFSFADKPKLSGLIFFNIAYK